MTATRFTVSGGDEIVRKLHAVGVNMERGGGIWVCGLTPEVVVGGDERCARALFSAAWQRDIAVAFNETAGSW